MKGPTKRRGISLTHIVQRPVAVCTNCQFANSNVRLLKSSLIYGNQPHLTTALPVDFRSSSAPKPQIIFTYSEGKPVNSYSNCSKVPIWVPERKIAATTPPRNEYLSGLEWQEQQRIIKESAFGGKYGSFTESKDTIHQRLFGTESPKHHHIKEFKVESGYDEHKSSEFEKNPPDCYSIASYNDVITRRRSRLELNKDVVSVKLKQKSKIFCDSAAVNGKVPERESQSQLLYSKTKPPPKAEQRSSKNLQNLLDMQKKLKEIIKICDQNI